MTGALGQGLSSHTLFLIHFICLSPNKTHARSSTRPHVGQNWLLWNFSMVWVHKIIRLNQNPLAWYQWRYTVEENHMETELVPWTVRPVFPHWYFILEFYVTSNDVRVHWITLVSNTMMVFSSWMILRVFSIVFVCFVVFF